MKTAISERLQDNGSLLLYGQGEDHSLLCLVDESRWQKENSFALVSALDDNHSSLHANFEGY